MEHYQYSRFDKHLVAVDCVIFGYEEGDLKVLLFHRAIEPALGRWSLLGGFIRQDETLGDAARRVLKKTTGLENVFQEQVYTFSKPDRDPAGRVISVTYFALIRIDQQNHELVMQYKAKWWSISKLPRLIFDHREMLDIALIRLQRKAETQLIGPELLGEPFTLTSLKKLYEAIFQQKLDAGNFRKRINTLGVLRNTGKKDKSGSKKGAYLYVVKPKAGWTKVEGQGTRD